MRYPVQLIPDGKFVMATTPDIPETGTQGDSEEEALLEVVDALETALGTYFDRNLPIPSPSKLKRGQPNVALPASLAAKVLLHNEMLSQKVRPAELARRLRVTKPEISRLLNPRHTTKIDMISKAFEVLGKSLVVSVA